MIEWLDGLDLDDIPMVFVITNGINTIHNIIFYGDIPWVIIISNRMIRWLMVMIDIFMV